MTCPWKIAQVKATIWPSLTVLYVPNVLDSDSLLTGTSSRTLEVIPGQIVGQSPTDATRS